MKNKKIKLLSSCIALVGTSFGAIYSVTNVNNQTSLALNNEVNTSNEVTNYSSKLNSATAEASFAEFASGTNLKGNIMYELNEENQTVRIIKENQISGSNITFNDTFWVSGKSYRITAIVPYAFNSNTKLVGTISFGNSISVIGDNAFEGCTGLTGGITFGNNVKVIGDNAFKGCTGLNSTVSFNSLSYLGKSAFEGCTSLLGSISIKNGLKAVYANTFKNTKITQVTFSESVTEIGVEAFSGCTGLTNVILPNSITTVGTSAFAGCTALANISLSNNLSKIESYTFSSCTALTSINIPNTVTYIGTSAFSSDSNLTTLTINAQNSMLKTIDTYAFKRCSKLVMFDLPIKLEIMGDYCFQDCSAFTGSIYIPTSVKNIGSRIYQGCGLQKADTTLYSVQKEGYNKWCLGHNGNYSASISIESNTYGIASNSFYSTSTITGNIILNQELVRICDYAFYNLSAAAGSLLVRNGSSTTSDLSKMSNLEYIGERAFYNDIVLNASVALPSSLKEIGARAFYNCSAFTSLNIPYNPNIQFKIGESAFYNCSAIKGNLLIPANTVSVGANAFMGCTGLSNYVANQVCYSSESTAYSKWCLGVLTPSATLSASQVTVDTGTVGIAGAAFLNETNLTTVQVPSTVKYVGDSAFSGCIKLANDIRFDNATIETIGNSAFENCSSLKRMPFSLQTVKKLSYIGDKAFSGCASMQMLAIGATTIKFSSTIEYVGASAFENCQSLEGTLAIGHENTFDLDKESIFKGCVALTKVDLTNSNVKTIAKSVFEGCSEVTSAALPQGLTAIGESAFSGCTALKLISIPASVKIIDKNAYLGCTEASCLVFEGDKGLEIIGESAFSGCTKLQGKTNEVNGVDEIVMPETLKEIGEHAFKGDKNIGQFTFNASVPPKMDYGWLDFDDQSLKTKIQIPYGSKQEYFDANVGVSIDHIKYFDITKFEIVVEKTTLVTTLQQAREFNNFSIDVNAKSSPKAKFTITPTGSTSKMPNWLSIDEKTGILKITRDCEQGTYDFIVTATSEQDPTVVSSVKITLKVSDDGPISKWWLWLIIILACLLVIGGAVLIYKKISKNSKKSSKSKK